MNAPVVCANCGTEGSGRYCSNCGQRLETGLPSAREWLAEVVDAFFSLDGRVLRTLRLLAFKPGALTADMIEGKRARYIPPLRLYLVCSILYFFAASFTPEQTRFMFATFGFGDRENVSIAEILPRLMFLVVPLVALLQKGIYRKQQPSYAAHLISVLHLFSFWYVIFAVDRLVLLPTEVVPAWATPFYIASAVLQLSAHAYLFMALRRLFQQGVLLTIGKQFLWILGFSLALALGVLAWASFKGWL